jgi:hypothetical protein
MAWQDRELEYKNLQAVQSRLGEISMIWAAIDRLLDRMITDMLDISHAEAAAVLSGMLPAKKCEIVQRLIVIDCPDKSWAEKASSVVKEISGSLGPERNRLVHDSWRFDQHNITRIDSTARTHAAPHTGRTLVFDTNHDVTLEDLKK